MSGVADSAQPAVPVLPGSGGWAETAVPVLPSGDLGRAEAFYRYLGFEALGRTADYLRMARGDIELHFYLAADHDPLTNSAGCYLRVSDPAVLRKDLCGDGLGCHEVPESLAYGVTVFALVDPDGNTLRYGPAR